MKIGNFWVVFTRKLIKFSLRRYATEHYSFVPSFAPLLPLAAITGFAQVLENLESHGIYYFNFQAWKFMEFK